VPGELLAIKRTRLEGKFMFNYNPLNNLVSLRLYCNIDFVYT